MANYSNEDLVYYNAQGDSFNLTNNTETKR